MNYAPQGDFASEFIGVDLRFRNPGDHYCGGNIGAGFYVSYDDELLNLIHGKVHKERKA